MHFILNSPNWNDPLLILYTLTGISDLIHEHPQLVQGSVYSDPKAPVCRKNIGKSKSLRKWSRGHQFVVRGGGHIDTWQPLYRYMHFYIEP